MKLFRIAAPGRDPALLDLDGDEPVAEIVIGERGRGRSTAVIPIKGYEGDEVRAKKVRDTIVLVRGDWDDDDGRCLAVVNAVGAYSKGRSYRVRDANGLEVIASGSKAFGQAGRAGGGEEVLAIVEEGAEFRLRSKYASHWYRWDGSEWKTETPAERDARLALEEVEQGGDEGGWL
jgi:hypothetical protein